jgi:hypothetical protein
MKSQASSLAFLLDNRKGLRFWRCQVRAMRKSRRPGLPFSSCVD